MHALLNIPDNDALLGHPVAGASWEGFAMENLIGAAPRNAVPLFYRTSAGAEIDLLLEIPGHGLWAIEIKLGLHSRPRPGFHIACEDLRPAKRFVVNSSHERQMIAPETESIGLRQLASVLAGL
jgi:hypothetical protein